MANTLIQIKRSTSTNQPSNGSLSIGELAYSYASNVAFIGTSGGNAVSPIGGRFYVEKTNSAYDIAVSAFDRANAANLFAFNTGIGANAFASATIAGANAAVGTGANTYANATFVRLVAGSQTITGDLAIVGNLTFSGNTTFSNVQSLIVNDPLIYLAGNNTSDIVDIGFFGNYVNATGSNVHTGLYREHLDKMYYLFQNYDKLPDNNHIGAFSNNMTLAVLNADLRTSNLSLGGINAISWITAAFDKSNTFNNVYTTIAGSNTAGGAGANAFASATIAGANTAVGAGANAFATAAAAGANAFMISVQNGSNTAIGAGANTVGAAAFNQANTAAQTVNLANATGTLIVARGGTGTTSFTANGILFGNGTGAVQVTAAAIEGKVLQAGSGGGPVFADLDGGSF